MADKILIVQAAALGYDFLINHNGSPKWLGLDFNQTQSIFPALTCPVQATMRTATLPSEHGMVFNGTYIKQLNRPSFWEQSSTLVSGERIWQKFKKKNGRVGFYFWQQSLGENVDLLLSPAPIHTHGGSMIDAVYSKPENLYDNLKQKIGKKFRLSSYWGPFSSQASTRWISKAAAETMAMAEGAPELLFVYLPHLDYSLQKNGPDSASAGKAFNELTSMLTILFAHAKNHGYEILIYGDYAIGRAKTVLWPNLQLFKAGLLNLRSVRGMLYPDFNASAAFAVTDHEAAHVYLNDPQALEPAIQAFREMPGEFTILTKDDQPAYGVDHPNSGDLILAGKNGTWFWYGWWTDKKQAPDYATHIDIHNKPGFDPCELFRGWHPFIIDTDPTRIMGTHGCTQGDRSVAWANTFGLDLKQESLVQVAQELKTVIASL